MGPGRDDLVAVLDRLRGKKAPRPSTEWISEVEAYQIVVHESRLQAGDIDSPTGDRADITTGPEEPSPPPILGANATVIDRVANRFYEARSCVPPARAAAGDVPVQAARGHPRGSRLRPMDATRGRGAGPGAARLHGPGRRSRPQVRPRRLRRAAARPVDGGEVPRRRGGCPAQQYFPLLLACRRA